MTTTTQRSQPRLRQVLAILFLSLCNPMLAAQEESSSLDRIEDHIQRQRWKPAVQASAEHVAHHPDDPYGWYYLAYAHHNLGQLPQAIEAGQRAIQFEAVRAVSLYNLACAHSLQEEVEQAGARLEEALAAGYLDLDHIATDPELSNLRRVHPLELPPARTYESFEGRNGVEFHYLLQLPPGHDPERPISIAVVFGPGSGGPRATDWNLATFWDAPPSDPHWAVVHLVAPERGWRNHPAHHALEDLFKQLRKDHKMRDGERFHLFGYGAGASPAVLYASMSRRYTASLSLAATGLVRGWTERDFRRRRDVPTQLLISKANEYQMGLAEHVVQGLTAEGGVARLVPIEDTTRLETRAGGGFLRDIQHLRERTP